MGSGFTSLYSLFDDIFFMQLRVKVQDQGLPPKFSTTSLKVTINRNFYDPRFDQSRYSADIEESLLIGSVVARVRATDGDRKVSLFYLI